MIQKERIIALLHPVFETRKDLFLMEIKVSTSNQIDIIIDGDHPISVQDCLDVSRAIEFNLDRDDEDFSLLVSSPGADAPIETPRQYNKLLEKELEIITTDAVFTGELTKILPEGIEISYSERIPKEKGKGKQTVVQKKLIPFIDIKKSKVNLKI